MSGCRDDLGVLNEDLDEANVVKNKTEIPPSIALEQVSTSLVVNNHNYYFSISTGDTTQLILWGGAGCPSGCAGAIF